MASKYNGKKGLPLKQLLKEFDEFVCNYKENMKEMKEIINELALRDINILISRMVEYFPDTSIIQSKDFYKKSKRIVFFLLKKKGQMFDSDTIEDIIFSIYRPENLAIFYYGIISLDKPSNALKLFLERAVNYWINKDIEKKVKVSLDQQENKEEFIATQEKYDNIKHYRSLPEYEFFRKELKSKIDSCVRFVLGIRDKYRLRKRKLDKDTEWQITQLLIYKFEGTEDVSYQEIVDRFNDNKKNIFDIDFMKKYAQKVKNYLKSCFRKEGLESWLMTT